MLVLAENGTHVTHAYCMAMHMFMHTSTHLSIHMSTKNLYLDLLALGFVAGSAVTFLSLSSSGLDKFLLRAMYCNLVPIAPMAITI